jgi:hypothetical protein
MMQLLMRTGPNPDDWIDQAALLDVLPPQERADLERTLTTWIDQAPDHATLIRDLPQYVERALAEPRPRKRREQAIILRSLAGFFLRFPVITDLLTPNDLDAARAALDRLDAANRRPRTKGLDHVMG